MSQMQVKTARNQSIECLRLTAAVFVVFIHSNFPGAFGEMVNCLARFAVPLFFMISGYFSFGASKEKLACRFKRILWLNVFASLLYMLHRFLVAGLEGAGLVGCIKAALPSLRQLVEWVILNTNPFVIHLWYLAAIALCYLALLGYVSFQEEAPLRYQPFYIVCVFLYVIQFVMGEMAVAAEIILPPELGRNALLFGLPMFGLGLFLGEHRERLVRAWKLTEGKLAAVAVLGLAFGLVERLKVGLIEAPIGMVAAAAALLLLAAAHPQLPLGQKAGRVWIPKFGFLTTAVYILHLMVMELYGIFCQEWLSQVLGQAEPWLRPVAVLILTFAAALICERLRGLKQHIPWARHK